MKEYWVYMLLCADGHYYVGVTSDLEYRVAQHNYGWNPRCYTHTRRPVTLVYSENFYDPYEAIAAEKKIKGWGRAKKAALVRKDWTEVSRLARSNRGSTNVILSLSKDGRAITAPW